MANFARCLAVSLGLVMHASAINVEYTGENASGKPWRQTLANFGDLQYYGTIEVGKQKLHGVFDTGSIELVVLSDKCDYWCGHVADLYHARDSGSYKRGHLSISMSYGSGDLKGGEAYDTVGIGPFKASDTPFWEVSDATMPVLLDSDFEAIIGLGPIASNIELMVPGKPKSNMSYALVLEKLGLRRYSVCLMRDSEMPGYLTWNEDLHLRQSHLFTELSITEESYWTVKLQNVRLGAGPALCQKGCGAILDSGTSLIAMPEKAYFTMSANIRKLGFRCNDLAALPNLQFMLNGVNYSLPPDSYLGVVHGKVPTKLVGHFEKTSAGCQPSIMRVHMSSKLGESWILGMPFFRSFLTVFDQSRGKKPSVFTARVGDDCSPQDTRLALGLQQRRSARTIDAAKLRLPHWAQGQRNVRNELVRQVLLGDPPTRHLRHGKHQGRGK